MTNATTPANWLFTSQIALSPDGRVIAAAPLDPSVLGARLPSRLVLYDARTGRELRVLVLREDGVSKSPVWSPEGRWVAFPVIEPDDSRPLYRVPRNGGRPRRMTIAGGAYTSWTR